VDEDEIKTETERNNIKFFSIDTYLVNMRNENLRNNEESQQSTALLAPERPGGSVRLPRPEIL